MKGAGGSYGFQAITDIGAGLEQAAVAPTPRHRAGGWASCPATWIASRSSPTSGSLFRVSLIPMRSKAAGGSKTAVAVLAGVLLCALPLQAKVLRYASAFEPGTMDSPWGVSLYAARVLNQITTSS